MEFLAWLEHTALATWVRESGSLWAYPTILTLHTIGLAVLAGANAVLALRMLGVAARVPLAPLAGVFPFIWAGFAVNAVSGVALFIADASLKGTQPVFLIKLSFIAAGLINVVLTRRYLARNAAALATGPVTPAGRALAAAALAMWAGAITAGRLMAYL